MKYLKLISIVCFLLLLVSCSQQVQNVTGLKSQEEILTEIRKAVQEQDVAAVMQLGYWGNVSPKVRDGMDKHIPNCFDYTTPTFKFREMSKEERAPVAAKGKMYVWNMEPVGYVMVEGSSSEDGSLSIPIGLFNGKYYICSRYQKD